MTSSKAINLLNLFLRKDPDALPLIYKEETPLPATPSPPAMAGVQPNRGRQDSEAKRAPSPAGDSKPTTPPRRRTARTDLHITKHFRDNWAVRVGGPEPSPDMINQIIAESIRVQPGKLLADRTGNPHNVFAVYWHPDLSLIIKMDVFTGAAVTVLSPENGNKKRRRINEIRRF